MKLKTIEIENYKSIQKLTIDFDSNSKVIIGSNDKTRTDVLDAIAIAINGFFGEFHKNEESLPLPILAYYPVDREIFIFETLTDYTVLKEILTIFDLPTDPCHNWSESTRNTKYLFSIVADLALREDSGIVLIDAIELHLDLKWQREFLPKLRDCFPNIQFITSTASPLVLSTTKPQDVIILESTQDKLITKSAESSYGQSCDRILEDLLDTTARPEKIKQTLHYLFEMIDKGNIDEAIAIKEDLTKQIGSDPELTKAEVLIKRQQSLKKQVT